MEPVIGAKVVIGPKNPKVELRPPFDKIQAMGKRGNATVRDIIPAGQVFPPSMMWRYYRKETKDPEYNNLQKAWPVERIVLYLEERVDVQRKRFGKMVDATQAQYVVIARPLFDAFVYEAKEK